MYPFIGNPLSFGVMRFLQNQSRPNPMYSNQSAPIIPQQYAPRTTQQPQMAAPTPMQAPQQRMSGPGWRRQGLLSSGPNFGGRGGAQRGGGFGGGQGGNFGPGSGGSRSGRF